MSEFKHVGRVMVSLWGQRVGIIVPVGSRGETYAFQYDRKFLKSGLEIAPLMMPLRFPAKRPPPAPPLRRRPVSVKPRS